MSSSCSILQILKSREGYGDVDGDDGDGSVAEPPSPPLAWTSSCLVEMKLWWWRWHGGSPLAAMVEEIHEKGICLPFLI